MRICSTKVTLYCQIAHEKIPFFIIFIKKANM